MLDGRIGITLDRGEIIGRSQHTLGQKEACSELAVSSRRAHDDREWPPVKANLERLLGGGAIDADSVRSVADAENLHRLERREHFQLIL
jgi:hypothetical protein